MASSANPLCISSAFLLCLGLKASARGTDPHKRLLHRVRSITFSSPTYLLYHNGFYVKDIGIGDHRHLPLRCSLPKVHTKFRLRFWLKLSSDPSLANVRFLVPSSGKLTVVSSGTLALLPTNSLLSGLWSEFHRLAIDHTGRTIPAFAGKTISFLSCTKIIFGQWRPMVFKYG